MGTEGVSLSPAFLVLPISTSQKWNIIQSMIKKYSKIWWKSFQQLETDPKHIKMWKGLNVRKKSLNFVPVKKMPVDIPIFPNYLQSDLCFVFFLLVLLLSSSLKTVWYVFLSLNMEPRDTISLHLSSEVVKHITEIRVRKNILS